MTFPSYGASHPYNPAIVSSLACSPVAKYFSYPFSGSPFGAEGCPESAGDVSWPLGLHQKQLWHALLMGHLVTLTPTKWRNKEEHLPYLQYILVINAPLKSSINTFTHSLGGTTEPPTGWGPWGRIHFPGAKIFHTSNESPQSKKSNRQGKKI